MTNMKLRRVTMTIDIVQTKKDLDKYFYELNTIDEQNNYINFDVINQIRKVDYSFTNSHHTQEILKKYYKII